MLLVCPTHQGDVALLERLLLWMEALDGKLNHDCLIVFDRETPFDAATRCHALATRLFREVRTTATRQHVSGWPQGPNTLFFHAAKFIYEDWPQPWLLMEPDAIPLRSGWLDALEVEYTKGGSKHMGHLENTTHAHLPALVMSGVAIYSANIGKIPRVAVRPWNVDLAELLVPEARHTDLIKDFFGQKDLPPVFVADKKADSPINALTLDFIPTEAVLWHRDKSHSLMPLLAKKLGIPWEQEIKTEKKKSIVVVFPVHSGDLALAIRHAQWLQQMQRWWDRAVIAYDPTANRGMVNQLRQLLSYTFETVELFQYSTPPIPTYPATANWMFQSVALRMAAQANPWLLMEADTVALKPDWLDQLQREYDHAHTSWMGPHVKGMSHSNGVMVYPADAARRMPQAMSCGPTEAFDMAAAGDIMHDCHDCDHLLFHTWSVLNGEWCPVGGGHVPVNITLEMAQKIPRTAVAIHRVKCPSLINLLASGAFKP